MQLLPRRSPLPNFSGFLGEAPHQPVVLLMRNFAIPSIFVILTYAAASFFWGSAFASTGPIIIGSLVADREKGLRHQLQMTGLPHRACVHLEVLLVLKDQILRLKKREARKLILYSYWIGSFVHDVIFQLVL
jgi:hypothetical protein